jgi:putative monooxygenase
MTAGRGAADPADERPPVAVVDISTVTPIADRGGSIRVIVTPGAVGARHHIFGQAVLAAGERINEHIHDYGEESVFVVSGAGSMTADDVEYELLPGRLIFCPRGTRHAIHNDRSEELVMIFASAPLAPSPGAGHRELKTER